MNEPKPLPRDIMSETPSTIEFHSAGYFHPDAIVCSAKQAEALFAALTQAQARCAELTGLLREVYGEFAKRHIRSTDLQSRIDAALKEPR